MSHLPSQVENRYLQLLRKCLQRPGGRAHIALARAAVVFLIPQELPIVDDDQGRLATLRRLDLQGQRARRRW